MLPGPSVPPTPRTEGAAGSISDPAAPSAALGLLPTSAGPAGSPLRPSPLPPGAPACWLAAVTGAGRYRNWGLPWRLAGVCRILSATWAMGQPCLRPSTCDMAEWRTGPFLPFGVGMGSVCPIHSLQDPPPHALATSGLPAVHQPLRSGTSSGVRFPSPFLPHKPLEPVGRRKCRIEGFSQS